MGWCWLVGTISQPPSQARPGDDSRKLCGPDWPCGSKQADGNSFAVPLHATPRNLAFAILNSVHQVFQPELLKPKWPRQGFGRRPYVNPCNQPRSAGTTVVPDA